MVGNDEIFLQATNRDATYFLLAPFLDHHFFIIKMARNLSEYNVIKTRTHTNI